MNRRAIIVIVAIAALAACEDATLHIRLGASPTGACDDAVSRMHSFYTELQREEAGEIRTFKKCVELTSGFSITLDHLEQTLTGRIAFHDVPAGGTWTIWVQGFDGTCCRNLTKFPLLCGKEKDVAMSSDEIMIDVQCVWVADKQKVVEENCRCIEPQGCGCD